LKKGNINKSEKRKAKNAKPNSYIIKMVSQFTGYPVEELKSGSGWLTVSTNSHLAIENLYLKLTTSINWSTGKPGNWITK